jgi:hypothetical protein
MRMVEIRDFMNGQGWFDLHQYRLGPAGGTLMHWSRLIDAPIAVLIVFFSLFLTPHMAEVWAVFVWPLLLVVPLMAAMALAAYRLGGKQAMLMSLILAALFLTAIIRFRPGAIDHHNVQLILATVITAMLLDPLARASNFAIAALASALALAIGVETTPLVVVAAAVVALLWAVQGEAYRQATIGYGLVLAISISAIFFGTTPQSLWSSTVCDTLSLSFLSLATVGGLGLAACAAFFNRSGKVIRLLALAGVAILVGITAVTIAPQCLQNPYAGLDPLLKTMWLGSVTEAQSIVGEMAINPEAAGGFYAVGLLGMAVSAFRVMRRQQVTGHAVLFVLIGISWLVTLIQVRGMIFANFLAFIPLAALIADLRGIYQAQQNSGPAAVAFVLSALASIPSVWTFSGVMVLEAGQAVAGVAKKPDEEDKICITEARLKVLDTLPLGRILSTTNPGSILLRYTPHAVLTANYHRNQTGMVDALKIGMAEPAKAWTMMKDLKVGYVLLCKGDPQVGMMTKDYPAGFFARLAKGDVPEFLEPIDHGGDDELLIFKVL